MASRHGQWPDPWAGVMECCSLLAGHREITGGGEASIDRGRRGGSPFRIVELQCGPALQIRRHSAHRRVEQDWAARSRLGPEPVSGSAFPAAVSDWKRPEAGAGPMVRIRFPPTESPVSNRTRPLQVENRGFRAGVRRSVGARSAETRKVGAIRSFKVSKACCGAARGETTRPAIDAEVGLREVET